MLFLSRICRKRGKQVDCFEENTPFWFYSFVSCNQRFAASKTTNGFVQVHYRRMTGFSKDIAGKTDVSLPNSVSLTRGLMIDCFRGVRKAVGNISFYKRNTVTKMTGNAIATNSINMLFFYDRKRAAISARERTFSFV